MNYSSLKSDIAAVVKQNGNQEITGENLQGVLTEMIDNSVGTGYLYKGIATPETQGGTPDQNVFYLAGAGTYGNFGGTIIPKGFIGIFSYNGVWSYNILEISEDIFDISEYNNTSYANLSAALNGNNIPINVRKGGMSVKFVQTSDNKYVQFRYMLEYENTTAGNVAFINPNNWDNGIDGVLNINKYLGHNAPFGSRIEAIMSVPVDIRTQGLTVTYLLSSNDNWVSEKFINGDLIQWEDGLWQQVSSIKGEINVEEKIIVKDNNDLEVASIDENGVHAKGFIYEDTDIGSVAKKLNEYIDINDESLIEEKISVKTNDNTEVAFIDSDGVHVEDLILHESFENDGIPIQEYIEEQIDAATNKGISVNLPDKVIAVVGDTLQLFYRGTIKAANPYVYDIRVTCTKGMQTPRYFQVSPSSADVGSYPLTVYVKNNNGDILASKQTTLQIVNKTSLTSSNKVIACFGDSLTQDGVWCKEADRRLSGTGGTPAGLELPNVLFKGQMNNSTTGFFGKGGWIWTDYTTSGRSAYRFQVTGVSVISTGAVYSNNGHNYTVIENNTTAGTGSILCAVNSSSDSPQASGTLTKVSGDGDTTITFTSASLDSQNPLWDYTNNKMTFVPYADEYCKVNQSDEHGIIDVVYVLIGWNSISAWQKTFTSVISAAKVFADTLHAEFPNAKLKIMGLQVPSINGGLGANYGAANSHYSDSYGLTVAVMNLNNAYQDLANSTELSGNSGDSYNTFVEFVNISSEFDSEYNMQSHSIAVNTRNSSKEEMIGTNGVHPATEGYMQIADTVYRNLVKYLNN